MIIPISTNTTIATCVQIQKGDTGETAYLDGWAGTCADPGAADYRVGMAGRHRTRAGRLRMQANSRLHGPREMVAVLVLGLCALAWLVPAGDATAAPSAHASSTPPLGGVNIVGVGPGSLREADQAISQARALHAKVVRTTVSWSVMEPNAPGQIEPRTLAFADRLVSDAAAAGIRVIMLVDSSPCWASSAPSSLLRRCVSGRMSSANAWPPSNPATYAAFVAYLQVLNRIDTIALNHREDLAEELCKT